MKRMRKYGESMTIFTSNAPNVSTRYEFMIENTLKEI